MLLGHQVVALESVGREIALGWIAQGEVDRDYDFAADGDWMRVREVAREAGLAWSGSQPDDVSAAEVWDAVERGYRSAL